MHSHSLPQFPDPSDAAEGSVSAHSPGVLPVSETFVSIQGEGLLTGVPSAFLRLSGCNLRCAWCDTPYASWSPEGSQRSIDDLVHWTLATGARHAVLTGGEPMMFPALPELSSRLAACGIHITIETAGTILPLPPTPPSHPHPLVCDLMSISPKLEGSTPRGDPRDPTGAWATRHQQRRLNLPVLQQLLDQYPAPKRQLKFVIAAPADLEEVESLLSRLRGWTPADVLLMPEGTTEPAPERRQLVVNACLAKGYRYCHRLHITLFGNKRGT